MGFIGSTCTAHLGSVGGGGGGMLRVVKLLR